MKLQRFHLQAFKTLYMVQYEKIMGISDVIECEKCGDLVRKKSNKMRYCKECAKEVYSEQSRQKALKYYHKTKNFTK